MLVNNVNNFFKSLLNFRINPSFFDNFFVQRLFSLWFSHFLTELLTFLKIMQLTLRQLTNHHLKNFY